jgi:hypothetical protein
MAQAETEAPAEDLAAPSLYIPHYSFENVLLQGMAAAPAGKTSNNFIKGCKW